MKFLNKNYNYETNEIKITYNEFIERILDAFYKDFRIEPNKKAIKLINVWVNVGVYEGIYCEFVICDTKKIGLLPKKYMLNYTGNYIVQDIVPF